MKAKIFMAVILVLGMTSCSTYYKMSSRIEADGSMHREVYALGDSAFRAGDKSQNPFLFQLNDKWRLVIMDSTRKYNFWGDEEPLNVIASQRFPEVNGEYFSTLPGKEYMKPLVVPHEKLDKKFRWFYTYYEYTATYHELPDKGPVPLSKFLTPEEQQIWFRGDEAAYAGLNGMELDNKLDDIGSKFWQWYNCTQFEISFRIISQLVENQGDTTYLHCMEKQKESVSKKVLSANENFDGSPEAICSMFDEACRTKYFLGLYASNKDAMDKKFEKDSEVSALFYYAIKFELTMPGKLIATNADSQSDDGIAWRVDAFRLVTGDYLLTAESKMINYWAFGVTLLLILACFGICLRRYRRK